MMDLLDDISYFMLLKNETVGIAESVTGGHLQFLLSTCTNAQQFFEGGITAYNKQQKIKQLGINSTLVYENNAVSLAVARGMAKAAAQLFLCDWAIGITGYSTPPPDNQAAKPYCYFSIRCRNKEILSEKIYATESEKSTVQEFFAWEVIRLFSTELKKHTSKEDEN
jgi:PncC family amidohydrolase